MLKVAPLLSTLCALSLIACGGSDSAPANAPPEASANTPASAPAAEPTRAAQELSRFLLQLSDMPTGYSVAPPDDDDDEDDSENPECDIESPFKAVGSAEVSFQQSDFGPFVNQIVASFKNEIEAAAAMKLVSENFKKPACASNTDDKGQTTTYSQASYPKIGDETFALNISVQGAMLPASGRAVFIREGQFVTVLVMAGIMLDATPLEGLARKAHAKLP